ncbi:MAG: AAA family ATPase [Alphaproteobacteria bacterium]|nr:AAA family ATPase [Alphaproteobacteria bacterium]
MILKTIISPRAENYWKIENSFQMKRYILAGTPGVGKTTLLRAFDDLGYPVVEEAATDLITRHYTHGAAEPWKRPAFIDNIVKLQKERQLEAPDKAGDVQFHDRAVVCTYALAQYLGFDISDVLMEEINRTVSENVFERDVFFIRPLGFCIPTDVRTINYDETLKFEKIHEAAYEKFGYNLVSIEKNPVDTRVEDILKHVGLAAAAAN